MSEPIGVPDFDIRVNGKRIPADARAAIVGISVHDDLDVLSMFALTLVNWDQRAMRVTWSDSDLFTIGNEVAVALGYRDDLTSVILGEITGLEPDFTADGPPTITVRGYDHQHRLSRGRKTRTFARMTDSDIAQLIARGAGLRAETADTGAVLDYVVQNNQTDLDFLRRRAQSIGYRLFAREKVLHFQPPGHAQPPSAVLTVGSDISAFTARLSSMDQVGEVTVRGWDPETKDAVVGTARAGEELTVMGGTVSGPSRASRVFDPATTVVLDDLASPPADVRTRALGQLNDLALGYVHAEAECAGNPRLSAGTVVEIKGAGETFSGAYYVSSVAHSVSTDHGYRTDLDLRRNAT